MEGDDGMEYRREHPKAFKKRYHKRSNSESTNSSLKRKYGEFLRSRKWHTQKRESGLKVITYNIRLLIRFRIRLQLKLWD